MDAVYFCQSRGWGALACIAPHGKRYDWLVIETIALE
jgi:hypothetical protein